MLEQKQLNTWWSRLYSERKSQRWAHLDAKARSRGKGLDPDLAGDVPGPAPAEAVRLAHHHHGASSLGCVEVDGVDEDDQSLLLIHHHRAQVQAVWVQAVVHDEAGGGPGGSCRDRRGQSGSGPCRASETRPRPQKAQSSSVFISLYQWNAASRWTFVPRPRRSPFVLLRRPAGFLWGWRWSAGSCRCSPRPPRRSPTAAAPRTPAGWSVRKKTEFTAILGLLKSGLYQSGDAKHLFETQFRICETCVVFVKMQKSIYFTPPPPPPPRYSMFLYFD